MSNLPPPPPPPPSTDTATEVQPGGGWWKADDGAWYPPQWEYMTLEGSLSFGREKFEEALNAAGRDGWEAISLTGNATSNLYVLLKRQVM